jgi:RNA polymerase sigma-70 factor (ECF subfamily)
VSGNNFACDAFIQSRVLQPSACDAQRDNDEGTKSPITYTKGEKLFPSLRCAALRNDMSDLSHTREAFEALVEPQLAVLLRLARRLARERQDAEDLVQDTCLKAYRAFHQFQLGSDCKAWLIAILINTYRDWVRKSRRHPRPVGFDDFADFYSQLRQEREQTSFKNPENVAMHADLERVVRMAIDDLPPEFRLAVYLADIEEYAYKEIAEILACPIGTVMSRLYRGRHLLQATLREVLES